ncbi:hypothetical protein ACFV6F_05220 [Kitasatospora phosalacinea]|uniref:hypothetical protein n=1 Tax=Kitasatospora phosalacinea TaxID=2065 RepID=UPI0036509354
MLEGTGKNVTLDEATYGQVRLLARAWAVSEGEAIRRLVKHFDSTPSPSEPAEVSSNLLAVHADYESNRVKGFYDPVTRSVEISSGPAAGRYKSPSGAAAAILRAYNPRVAPHRNGWSFFVVDETGELLQSVR